MMRHLGNRVLWSRLTQPPEHTPGARRGARARGTLVAASVLGGAALLSACGSSSNSAVDPSSSATVTVTATDSPSASTSSSAASTTCRTANLTIAIGAGQGAAGHDYVPVQFTNKGTSTCTLSGFPGVSFVGGSGGTQIGNPAKRATGGVPSTVTLQPGAVASATLGIARAEDYDAATCQVTPAMGLRVYPPDETHAAFVADPMTACASTGVTLLTISPIVTGPGTS